MLLEAEQDGTHFLLLLITETPQHLGGYTWVALTFLPVVRYMQYSFSCGGGTMGGNASLELYSNRRRWNFGCITWIRSVNGGT